MKKSSKIYIAGEKDLIGSAIRKCLLNQGYTDLVALKNLNLLDQKAVEKFFKNNRPEYVFLPSIKSGGILANRTYPADFIYQNLVCQTNVLHSACKYKVKKLLFLGSACSYPKVCPQPIKEEYLLTSPVEPTSEAYAIAKISGIKMCEAYNKQHNTSFIPVIPTNTFGPEDDFNDAGHVVPSLINKFHEAKAKDKKEVSIWGTGKPKREFVYIDDIAEACVFLMNNYKNKDLINIAGGKEVSIKKLAETVKSVVGFKGKIVCETDKPDGMPRRLLDSKKIKRVGWKPKVSLRDGLKKTYQWYKDNL